MKILFGFILGILITGVWMGPPKFRQEYSTAEFVVNVVATVVCAGVITGLALSSKGAATD